LLPAIDPATGAIAYPVRSETSFHADWSTSSATNTMTGMMFRRAFVDLVFVPPSHQLPLYVDFYLSTMACLMTGAIAVHDALYAYRMHGRNLHSNATVPGGAYNSSTRAWEPIRDDVLRMIQEVLHRQADALRQAFGDKRLAAAQAAVAAVIGKRPTDGSPPRERWADLLVGLLDYGVSRLGLRNRS